MSELDRSMHFADDGVWSDAHSVALTGWLNSVTGESIQPADIGESLTGKEKYELTNNERDLYRDYTSRTHDLPAGNFAQQILESLCSPNLRH